MGGLKRALVPLRRAEGESEARVTAAPFERFIAGLYVRRTAVATTMAGSAHWSAFPIEHAIADGLWPVLLRVAEKLGRAVVTERQVVEDIAPRVNRLVNAGLTIAYPSIEVACAAFTQEVIDSVYVASRGKSGSGSDMLQAMWQLPVAKFFATLIRAAQKYGDEIERTLMLIHDENTADEDRGVTFIDEGVLLDFNLLPSFLELESDQVVLPPKMWVGDSYQFLRDASWALDQLRARQVALMQLPLRLQTVPNDITSVASSVDYPWIRTQLLLAAADLPDREYMLGSEFMPAAQAVVTRDKDEIVASFFRRMTARGMTTDAAACAPLEGMVRDTLVVLASGLAQTTTLDLELLNSLFMVVRPEHLTFDRDTALRVALGTEVATESVIDEMSASAKKTYWRTHVIPVIAWETLTVDDIKHMANHGPIPLDVLAEGVVKMESDERDRAVEWLLQADMLTKNTVAYLIEQGAIVPTADFLALHYRKMPDELMARCLTDVLQKMDEETRAATLSPVLMFSMFMHASSRHERAIVENSRAREQLVKNVIAEIVDPDHRASRGITKIEHRKFVTSIGAGRWYRLVLAVEIVMREEEYLRGSEQGAGEAMARWDDIDGRLAVSHNLPKWLGLSRKRTQQILRAYAEDDVFAWLYAGHKDLSKRLAVYRAARERYYT